MNKKEKNESKKGYIKKGIILAGGKGSRLYPITKSISKQLLPIYDKPMIYYPLTTLMIAGINDILVITTPQDKDIFKNLLGNGSDFGIKISYAVQYSPSGLAESFIIGEDFISNQKVALILGDNIFYGQGLGNQLKNSSYIENGATIFSYVVKDPERYGVVEFNELGDAISIIEKPINPKNNHAITGLYFYDESVVEKAKSLKPSKRGELEITDLNNLYLKERKLKVYDLGRGTAWLDTGTFDSMCDATNFIKTIENRQGMKIGCPEEVAWRNGLIDDMKLKQLAKRSLKSGYGEYLLNLVRKD